MFRLASLFLTVALGSALLGFGGILPAYAIVLQLLFVVSVLLSLLMIIAGGIHHTRVAARAPVRVEKNLPSYTSPLDRR